jgi:hypothetical protein
MRSSDLTMVTECSGMGTLLLEYGIIPAVKARADRGLGYSIHEFCQWGTGQSWRSKSFAFSAAYWYFLCI